ncbi:MAG: AAA family ATPase [Deltaproteobacteria bacterium]|nr:AAA family ATPase [Deltaproteobacteria bacterium]MBW2136584.1 AAA family ATPase [Deltaproteobacteria bacterium]
MPRKKSESYRVPLEKLRWRLDPATLPFETTEDLKPLREIIGQERGVDAFRFAMGMDKPGYNVFVTGAPGSGRLSTVRKMLEESARKNGKVPDDLCYVNNFKNPEAPTLLRLKAGLGSQFKRDIRDFVETLKKEVPRLFESQEYLNRKKEIMEEYEKNGKAFFKDLDKKVREEGFALVDVQVGPIKRPEVVPLVDGNPMHLDQVEALVEKGRFPKEEFEELKEKQARLRGEIDQIFLELRDLQKEVQENIEKMDRLMFMKVAAQLAAALKTRYKNNEINKYLDDMLEDMTENLQIFMPQAQQQVQGMPFLLPEGDPFQPYQVNLMVDNAEQKGPPVIVENYPTYRNLFGVIERVVDRSGVWRTDFSKIKAGSFVKANGGYLVLNLTDVLIEPGVWPALKRALKTKKMEIQTYDPFYLFTTSGLKPEPIDINVKVAIISDEYLYYLAQYYDEDVRKIFKVRADFDTAMDKNKESILQFAEFIKMRQDQDELRPFDRTAVSALIEHAVRMTGRQEKISTSFPTITDLLREADYWAGQDSQDVVQERHVDKTIEARVYRSNKIEEHIQEMINRGTLLIDTEGEAVGQVNGLAVYSLGDYMFGKPSRITASTSMGRAGIINIEREADLSGNTHNKGMLIMSGYLRKKYAQDKPLTMSASIAFEQSYSGIDGDSASSTEMYALLSSLSGVPIRQYIAVTGSVNQKGEIQAIGGVNQKIEGFYDCCRTIGLNGKQGVMIPESNVKDLMLRKDVVDAVKKGTFHVYAVKTVDQGIEILTGKKAGELKPDGTYPEGTINDLVNRKLKELAEGLKRFGEEEQKEEDKKGKGKGGRTKKK